MSGVDRGCEGVDGQGRARGEGGWVGEGWRRLSCGTGGWGACDVGSGW